MGSHTHNKLYRKCWNYETIVNPFLDVHRKKNTEQKEKIQTQKEGIQKKRKNTNRYGVSIIKMLSQCKMAGALRTHVRIKIRIYGTFLWVTSNYLALTPPQQHATDTFAQQMNATAQHKNAKMRRSTNRHQKPLWLNFTDLFRAECRSNQMHLYLCERSVVLHETYQIYH